MTRSTEFSATVKHGARAVQPDIVVHALRRPDNPEAGPVDGADTPGPRIGLVVGKAVGSSVQRHRVARRLRHAAGAVVAELQPTDRVVIRALPSSRHAISAGLQRQLQVCLVKARLLSGTER